jgi:hypothetical protein
VSCIECTSSCIECVGWKLGSLKCWWLGVFIAPTTKVAVGEGCCRGAHRTLSGAPATSPNRWGSTVGASDNWAPGQSSGAPDSHCSLSGAPSGACSDSARAVAHCSLLLLQTTVGAVAVAPQGTPDSPVLHQTVRWIIAEWLPEFPKMASSELISLVHRTLPGAPDQGSLRLSLALFIWTLSWTFYWFVLNLWHL